MNYNDMSDFEINKAVAEALGVRGFHCENVGGGSALLFTNWKELDYCNNPSDAWPIIVENRITIEFGYSHPVRVFHETMEGDYINGDDDNPLRSAMIVYLMMSESIHD